MRIVHLTDIHLSKSNYHEFLNKYREALIKDLTDYNNQIPIDVILITGDLVDKGGHSLLEIDEFKSYKNPYDIFEEVFINPISERIGLDKSLFLFIPGNHDVNEKEILYHEECKLLDDLNIYNVENYLLENSKGFNTNKRIQNFKNFERKYHGGNSLYNYSNNHSTFVYEVQGKFKVGFLLINDSWRCKTRKFDGEDGKLFFGYHQLDYGLNHLEIYNTDLNICLFHHSYESFKELEQREVDRILRNRNIELYLFGHYHNTKFEISYKNSGSCLGIRGRAALNKVDEKASEYQPGYQIIDIDIYAYKISCIHYRKYIYDDSRFDYDTDTAFGGKDSGNSNPIFNLERVNRKQISMNLDKSNFSN